MEFLIWANRIINSFEDFTSITLEPAHRGQTFVSITLIVNVRINGTEKKCVVATEIPEMYPFSMIHKQLESKVDELRTLVGRVKSGVA